ncbi:aldo/keto reductase [Ligilactobacillus acidipiscis]|uniref:aldo/keto reductase n=1 Tax=Ligilactobacillus acidipiscis TaxID=89059 RepID=UPI0022E4576F|nr:aldo/keto reductase [Ligilactobacillus acidipiscis]WEV56762.1 aldo/keto reductase [Ligilactobacillus acidipiscis]
MDLTSTYTLSNGVKIPVVGFGTWQTPDGDIAESSVKAALDAGYRHIDTAEMYGNEKSVGRAIKASGVDRNSLFVTSKLNNINHTYERATAALDKSLADLGLDHLDLFLIHWPNPAPYRNDNWEKHLQETWRAMEDAYKAGKVRAIGVSNFYQHHLEVLEKTQTITPMVNQIHLCPGDHDDELVDYCRERGILLEAYSPFGTGKIFTDPTLQKLADETGHTIAQVCLRWSLQRKYLPLPKSVHAERIEENTHAFDFELNDEQMKKIDDLVGVAGYGGNPDEVNF